MTEAPVSGDVEISEDTFPDAYFRAYVEENLDPDGDGTLSEAERKAVTELDVRGEMIVSMAGIEYFPMLENLDCSANQIEMLDLSRNKRLKVVDCMLNSLTELEIGGCSELYDLSCTYNKLETLDMSRCRLLSWLVNENEPDEDEDEEEISYGATYEGVFCWLTFDKGVTLIKGKNTPVEEDTLILPEDLEEIESKAFAGIHDKTIVIPDSVGWIAEDAFEDTVIIR